MQLERGGEADAQIQRETVTDLRVDAGQEVKLNFKDMRMMSKGRVWDGIQCERVEEQFSMAQMLSLQLQNEAGDAREGPSTSSIPP